MKTLPLLIILFSFLVRSVNSQTVTTVYGAYDGNQLWNADTIKITDDVTINGTLTISPGTYIELHGHFEITADSILSVGNQGDTIIYSVKDTLGFYQHDNPGGGWKGLTAYYMELDYCRIMFVKDYHLLHILKDTTYLCHIRNSILQNNTCNFLVICNYDLMQWCYFRRNSIHIEETAFINNQLNAGPPWIVKNCRFTGNTLKFTGSIVNSQLVRNKIITLFGEECSGMSIIACIFEKNDSLAISCSSYGFLGIASSLFNRNRNSTIQVYDHCHTNISYNTFFENEMSLLGSFEIFINNIFYSTHKSAQKSGFGANWPINNLFKGGMDAYGYNGTINVEGNFDMEPQFNDTLNNDFHLTALSPCIDYTGVSDFYLYYPPPISKDLDGNPRVHGICADVGAYEFRGRPLNRPPILEISETAKILPGIPKTMALRFFDPDSGDVCHINEVISQTPEITAHVTHVDSTSVKIKITANSNWQGTGQIRICISDNHNASSSFNLTIIVSKKVCGQLPPNVVWGGDTVKVECNVIADTLTILPGTKIAFGKNCSLIIKDLLMAIGNDSSRILFTADDTNGYYKSDFVGWAGIKAFAEYGSRKAVLRYCDFMFATTSDEAGGAIKWGSKFNTRDTLVVTNCNFINNRSQGYGGAIYTVSNSNIKAIIKNNSFFNNTTEKSGGAIYADAPNVDISDCFFIKNSANQNGGAIFNNRSETKVSNCIFANNSAQSGGAIHSQYGVKIINSTFGENYAEFGGAIYGGYYRAVIVNCILWNDNAAVSGDELLYYGESLIINNSIIKGGLDSISVSDMNIIRNIYSENPGFADVSQYDFHLSEGSCAINSGIPDTAGLNLSVKDIDNNPRISDLYIDIGAYEYQSDSFKIWQHPQNLKLCYGEEGLLNTNASGGVIAYQWQKDGMDLSGENYRVLKFPSLDTSQNGSYRCRISSTDNSYITNTANVIVDLPVSIKRHTEGIVSSCEKEDTLLVMQTEGGHYNEYTWLKDGIVVTSQTDSLLRFSRIALNDEGRYYGIVKNSCNSDTTDCIVVSVYPAPQLKLGNDTAFCGAFTLKLTTNAVDSNYVWNTGSRDSTIVVDTGGIYWLRVANNFGCTNTDSIRIVAHAPPWVSLGADTSITTTDSLYLTTGFGYKSYIWNTYSEDPVILIQHNQPGEYEYWVWVVDSNGCSSGDTVKITVEQATMIDNLHYGQMKVYPNPFTGLIMLVSEDMLENILIEVYDIRGRLVFQRKMDHIDAGDPIYLNLSELSPGLYELIAGGITKKIIKR